MINIGPLNPPVSTPKLKHKTSKKEAVVTGSKINKDAPKTIQPQPKRERRQRKDRRQQHVKPLIDLRISAERRKGKAGLSIDIEV